MTVYHWLVVLILLLGLLLHGEKKGNIKFILVAVILLFCVYGLKDTYTVGVDNTSSYQRLFNSMEDTTWEDMPDFFDWLGINSEEDSERSGHDRNIAFSWLMKLGYKWTDGDYQLFITLLSAFVMIVFAHYLRRFSVSPLQSILLYFGLLFFTFNFAALKQSIAMSLVLLSMDAVIDRKVVRFLILTFIASMFHFPALVFLPAYWIATMRPGRSYLILLAVAFLVTYVMRDQIVDWMTDTYDTQIIDTGRNFFANKVIIMILVLAAAVVIRPPTREDAVYNAFLLFVGVASVLQTFSSYNNTFERLADYYFQFSVVFIPMVFEDVKLSRRYFGYRELKMVQGVGPYLICAFAIWRFLDHVQIPDAGLLPYQFYFQADKAEETLSAFLYFMS